MKTTPCLLFTSQRDFAFSVVELQLEACPDATLDEGVREQCCQSINRSESRAVGGDNDGRCKGGQSIAGLLHNDGFIASVRNVCSPHHYLLVLLALHHLDDPCLRAADQN